VKLMMYYIKNKQMNGPDLINIRQFSLIKEIYSNVVLANISPYLYAPQIYNDNKLLTIQMNIIVHIIKTNIMTDLANIIYAYIVTNLDTVQYQDIIKNLYQTLVNDELCLRIVKYILKVYNKEEKVEMSNDFIFQDVINYLQGSEFSEDISKTGT